MSLSKKYEDEEEASEWCEIEELRRRKETPEKCHKEMARSSLVVLEDAWKSSGMLKPELRNEGRRGEEGQSKRQ